MTKEKMLGKMPSHMTSSQSSIESISLSVGESN